MPSQQCETKWHTQSNVHETKQNGKVQSSRADGNNERVLERLTETDNIRYMEHSFHYHSSYHSPV